MKITFLEEAWEDYLYWQKVDKNMVKRINSLIKDALRSPFNGIGKPEPLKFDMAGSWARRIDEEHRFIYKIQEDRFIIIQCRYHY
jgi:toxin YoeB